MRRNSDQMDDSSSFQRTPSYRIATVQDRVPVIVPMVNGTGPIITGQASLRTVIPVPYEDWPEKTKSNSIDSNANTQWKRRSSYSDSTDSDLAKITWQNNQSSSRTWDPNGTVLPALTGSESSESVQRRGSYRVALKPTNQMAENKKYAIVRKVYEKLKQFAQSFIVHPDPNSPGKGDQSQLIDEPDPTYYRRWASLWLTWLIMFIMVLQFSMYSTTLGAYLPLIDPTADEMFAPWAISAYGFGQTIACPIFGWWSNYIKNNRLPMAVGIVLMIVGNIGYIFVEVFPPTSRKWVVFGFRFVIGLGGGIAGVIRAYCATAAKPIEYTKAVTGATAGLALAIMAGPGAQAMFTPIGYPGVSIGLIRIHMYNAPAFTSIFIGIAFFILLYTVLIQEYPGLAKDDVKDRWFVLPKYDMCATWVVIFCWFAAYLTITSFVMIGKSYTMVMFHWSYLEAVTDNGIIMGVFACISLIVFILYAYHGKKFDTRLQMYIGITMMCSFFFITFPWPGLPKLYPECGVLPCCHGTEHSSPTSPCVDLRAINRSNLMEISERLASFYIDHEKEHSDAISTTNTPSHVEEPHAKGHNENFPGGCQAVKYKWCESNTREPIGLYMGTFFLLAVGFPLANCAFSALFSKIIGPRRQGFMQGVIISGGAAARTSGPLFINYTFDWWGPRVSWGLVVGILCCSIALAAVYHRRLVPLNAKPRLQPGEHFRYKNGVLYRF